MMVKLNPLIQNIYGDLNFKKIGNKLQFVNASNVTNFSDLHHAKLAAERQIYRYYEQLGTQIKNIAQGFCSKFSKSIVRITLQYSPKWQCKF